MFRHIRLIAVLTVLWALSVGLLWWHGQGGLFHVPAEKLYLVELLLWLLIAALLLVLQWTRSLRLWFDGRTLLSRRRFYSMTVGAQADDSATDPGSGALTRKGLCDWLVALRDPQAHLVAMHLSMEPPQACANETSALVAVMRRHLRPTDAVVRWTNSEYLLLCPGLQKEMSIVFAERIRDCIHSEEDWADEITPACSIALTDGSAADLKGTLQRASKALQRARETGGNRVLDEFRK